MVDSNLWSGLRSRRSCRACCSHAGDGGICDWAGAGQGASNEPSGLYCHLFACSFGVGVEDGRGEASAGFEEGAIAGEGGGGMELALGVPRAGRVVGATIGVDAGFTKALGFL